MGKIITPFHFCMVIFILESALCCFPLMKDDLYGRTQENTALLTTKTILFISAILMLGISFYIKKPNPLLWKNYKVEPIIPDLLLIGILLAVVGMGVIVSFKKLGTLPIFYLNSASDTNQVFYEDVFSGPINYIGWGAGRILSTWLTISMVLWNGSSAEYIKRNWMLLISTILALVFNTMDGLRNMLFLSIITLIFALSMRGFIKAKHLVGAGIIAILFFALGGIFKQGEKTQQGMIFTTGEDFLDKALYSIVSYAEPNLFNLDNLIRLSPKLQYGAVFFSHLLPGPLVKTFMDQPDTAVQLLSDAGSFAQPGLTFRTIYADLFVDFGVTCTVLVSTLIYGFAVICFNSSQRSPYYLLAFIYIAPIICYFPMMNTLAGIQTFISLSVFLLLKFKKTHLTAF